MSDSGKPIKSPCIEVCALDDHNVCIGCYRTADEIIDWFAASDDRKRDILVAVQRRRLASS
ncbi:MAG: DUF1289 domain-containing protein [Halieaceae bacterium]|jgi:predicted Fe-S protein YdhL (DUF1289 family)|nr:DUF1289 domain-containing protein [Halieaceae bacterium]